jgi:lambda repressor-like predicted transcriptional regulator
VASAKSADWIKIKTEYETTNTSYRKIAIKYGVSFNTLKGVAKRESWAKCKIETHHKIATRTLQKTVVKIADRNARILNISDKLTGKIEQAIDQLENYIVTNKVTTRTVTYDSETKKPSKEIIVEEEVKDIVSGIIDKQGLSLLTASLERIQKGQRLAEGTLSAMEQQQIDMNKHKVNNDNELLAIRQKELELKDW